jgi:hypothetical protein
MEVEDRIAGGGRGVAAGIDGVDVVAGGVDLVVLVGGLVQGCKGQHTPHGYGSFLGGGVPSRVL